jgi:integrase
METARGHRDATAILIAYRHGLPASELVALRWDDIDFRTGKLHVRRSKGGQASVHPIGGKEMRALRKIQREIPEGVRTPQRWAANQAASALPTSVCYGGPDPGLRGPGSIEVPTR